MIGDNIYSSGALEVYRVRKSSDQLSGGSSGGLERK
jgi:hypothetical protein